MLPCHGNTIIELSSFCVKCIIVLSAQITFLKDQIESFTESIPEIRIAILVAAGYFGLSS